MAGGVKVWRTLYRQGHDGAVVPLELRAGMVAGQITPRAARQAPWGGASDSHRRRLGTVRMARMPESKESDGEEDASDGGGGRTPTTPAVAAGQACRGAKDNWTFLSDELPAGEEIIASTTPPSTSSERLRWPTGKTPRRRTLSLRPIGTSRARGTMESKG